LILTSTSEMLTPFKKRVNNTCLIYFKSQGNLEKKEKLNNIS